MPSPQPSYSSKPAAKPPRFIDRSEIEALEDAIHRRIAERAYSYFEESGYVHGNDLGNWLKAEREILNNNLEVRESGSWLAINASLPSVEAENVQIYVERCRVIVRAERKGEGEKLDLKKAHGGRRDEVFLLANLSAETDPATASASLKDGKLTLMVQKRWPGLSVA
jgi:HSP20 family molecular chaperone IbpA